MRVISPPSTPVRDVSVPAVVLAAGRSTRFGDANKLLADDAGKPVLERVLDTLRESAVDGVTVVARDDEVRALTGDVPTVAPDGPDQSDSLRAGIDALPDAADAALVALGDMPRVSPSTVNALLRAYRADRATAIAAGYDGERGNPVVFDARHFDALRAVTGDRGGRRVLETHGAILDTDDSGTRRDVDYPRDL